MTLKVVTPGGDGIRPEVISNTDLIVIRELCGGAMFSPTQGVDESGSLESNDYLTLNRELFAIK